MSKPWEDVLRDSQDRLHWRRVEGARLQAQRARERPRPRYGRAEATVSKTDSQRPRYMSGEELFDRRGTDAQAERDEKLERFTGGPTTRGSGP